MAAFDYTLNVPNPGIAFMQAYAAGRQQQAQQEHHQKMLTDLQGLRSDPSPQRFAEFYLMYPEMKDQVDAYRSTLADADKNAVLGGAQEVLGYSQAGKHDLAVEALTRRAEAARQSGRPDLAQQFDDVAKMYKISPEAGQFGMRITYNNLDPDGYKNLFGAGDDPLDKQYALDVQLYGPEEATRLRYAQRKASGTVTASGPAGTSYRWMGGAAPAPATKTIGGKTYYQQDGKWFEGEPPATIENTPAPTLGGNGMPTTLTRRQYLATVQAKGKEATDAWMARNNITVEGN